MSTFKKIIVTSFFVLSSYYTPANAQVGPGVPTFDYANLLQAINQVQAWGQQYSQMFQQIQTGLNTYNSISGVRNLGDILNNPLLQNVVPADLTNTYNAIDQNGLGGLTTAAKAVRNLVMQYNCEDRQGEDQRTCQSLLNQNAQNKSILQNAFDLINTRVSQIQALQARINTTTDAKSIQELQARIASEQTQIANDGNRLQVMASMAEAQRQAVDQTIRERRINSFNATKKLSDGYVYNPPIAP
ncbi:P-type DNA transfer protein VirB5 (plasmid) [Ampullimonas aquatilis]|uniref:P-type DNA transfer protein VirB5 n=1 Tax=Ampullimonas aquatilis TaxID=1341549 RepID=UPI003C7764A6